ITGSDSDLSIRTFVSNDKIEGAEIIQEGSIVLPAKEFSSIARSMPNNTISIKSIGALQVEISSGKSKFTLNGMDGNEYPKLPAVDGESFTIKGATLKSLIEKTVYAVSKSETRPILTGVNVFFENGKLGMVATDSHRLAKVVGGDIQGVTPAENVTLPEKTLKELPAIIDNSKEVIVM
ncbi:DNA polymerase III subunit beta, partial [Butyricicoccus sp. 1XD8-22]